MAGVAVECVNPSCSYTGFDSRAISLGPGVTATMSNNVVVGGCPQCGSDARVIDGVHHVLADGTYIIEVARASIRTFRSKSSDELESLAQRLRSITTDTDRSTDDVAADVAADYPWFDPILQRVRNNRSDLIALVAVLIALIELMLMMRADDGQVNNYTETNTYVTNVVVEALPPTTATANTQVAALVREVMNPAEPARCGPAKNSKCYCGSGKKYKRCHGLPEEAEEP